MLIHIAAAPLRTPYLNALSFPAPTRLQEVAAVAAASLPADVDGQQETPPACYVVASDLSAAPELVTDAQVEATGPLCAEAKTLESRLVSGLGWMVEEAQEVTNFTESNFAAVG